MYVICLVHERISFCEASCCIMLAAQFSSFKRNFSSLSGIMPKLCIKFLLI